MVVDRPSCFWSKSRAGWGAAVALVLAVASCKSPPAEPEDLAASELQKAADPRCEAPDGIAFHGRRRYVHGVNYAWREFGTDFGGLAAWGRGGVSGDAERIDRDFAAIAASGASVVRWWIFPELRGDGLVREASGGVPKLSERALVDLDRALALAQAHDLYLLLTLFSFDAFRGPLLGDLAGAAEGGTTQDVERIDIAPFVRDPHRLEELAQRVVVPLVDRASQGRHAHRVFGWDLINEPEWAVADLDQRNMCDRDASERTDCVSYGEMHWFLTRLSEIVASRIQGLPEHKKPLITVGGASPWEHRNWEAVPQDLLQFHFYDADYAHGPLTLTTDEPTILGEFPSWGLDATWNGQPALDARQLTFAIHDAGFRGGLGWTYNAQDPNSDWPALSRALRAFADAKGCQARF